MKVDFDVTVFCEGSSHGRKVFVAGFQYVPANDTAELRPHGVHWSISTGRTAAVSEAAQHVHDNNVMRLRLSCRKCPRPVVTTRLRNLAPVLDGLRGNSVSEVSLQGLAAIVASSSQRRIIG